MSDKHSLSLQSRIGGYINTLVLGILNTETSVCEGRECQATHAGVKVM